MLAQALLARARYVAAFSAVLEAKAAGASPQTLAPLIEQVESALGPPFQSWRKLVEGSAPSAG
jgi:hypothetical protein